MKHFLTVDRPIVAMVYADTPDEAKEQIAFGHEHGCDAFGFGTEKLKREYRTDKTLTEIFDGCAGKPFFVTSYRGGASEGYTDDECVDYLLRMQSCGATVCDVMGDLYHPEATEITYDPFAVEKQMKLIEKIHSRGSEVIMSCHQWKKFLPASEIYRMLLSQEERGADILKAVNKALDESELAEDFRIVDELTKTVHKPFLYLAGGDHAMPLRLFGPSRGVCMYLCRTTPEGFQPTIDLVRAIERR